VDRKHVRHNYLLDESNANKLNSNKKDRLLKRWEEELADFSSFFISWSLEEWLNRKDKVILL
jgi:hypothetical protein